MSARAPQVPDYSARLEVKNDAAVWPRGAGVIPAVPAYFLWIMATPATYQALQYLVPSLQWRYALLVPVRDFMVRRGSAIPQEVGLINGPFLSG